MKWLKLFVGYNFRFDLLESEEISHRIYGSHVLDSVDAQIRVRIIISLVSRKFLDYTLFIRNISPFFIRIRFIKIFGWKI